MPNDLAAGRRVKALDFPRAHFNSTSTADANNTSTSYVTNMGGATPGIEVGVRFMAPSSGRVCVVLSAGLRNNTANADRLFVSFRIFEGDPADNNLVQAEDVKNGRSTPSPGTADGYQFGAQGTMVDGLTPGTYYYAQIRHRTTIGSGTADVGYKGILVFPIP